eukprot:7579919-Pyramimonas_sp.AAC.1
MLRVLDRGRGALRRHLDCINAPLVRNGPRDQSHRVFSVSALRTNDAADAEDDVKGIAGCEE